jgi:hypothetical protein
MLLHAIEFIILPSSKPSLSADMDMWSHLVSMPAQFLSKWGLPRQWQGLPVQLEPLSYLGLTLFYLVTSSSQTINQTSACMIS